MRGGKYLILTVRGDRIIWIATARTERGLESSRRRHLQNAAPDERVVVLSAEEVVAWNKRSIEELEALAKL